MVPALGSGSESSLAYCDGFGVIAAILAPAGAACASASEATVARPSCSESFVASGAAGAGLSSETFALWPPSQ